MGKLGRLIIVVIITTLSALFLKPTIAWYFFIDEDLKTAANEPLESIGKKARTEALDDVNALINAAKNGENLSNELSYFTEMAKINYKQNKEPLPEHLQAQDILKFTLGPNQLIDFSANYRSKEVIRVKNIKNKALKLGLDLAGGLSIILKGDFTSLNEKIGREATMQEKEDALASALLIIKDRADQFGTVDPIIRRQGVDQILVELPGEKDPDAVNRLVMGKGSLAFHLVDPEKTQQIRQALTQNPALEKSLNVETGRFEDNSLLPVGYKVLGYYMKDDFGVDVFQGYEVVFQEVGLDGGHITQAQVVMDEFGKPQVTFSLDAEGATVFARLTENAAANQYSLAVIMENKVRSVASVKQSITGGRVAVSGFQYKEAVELSKILKTASLPINLEVQNLQKIGPSLGEESIKVGIKALVLGITLSFAFVLLYYTGAGALACIVLALNFILLLALLSFMGFTLTLNSMAGLVLTIAMAVDANILVFQRIKDELKQGKTRSVAIDNGFKKALWTVLDANITTAIAAICLALLATGPIKGFAVVLITGIVTTIFTSIYVLRLLFDIGTETFKRKQVLIGWRVKK